MGMGASFFHKICAAPMRPKRRRFLGVAPRPEVIRCRRAPRREQTTNKQSSHVMTIALE
jgi:hypothetical protein